MTNVCKVVLFLFAIGFLTVFSGVAEDLTAEQIIQKNIQAAGGKEKIESIKSASIQIGVPLRYISTIITQGKNLMKMVDGFAPIIENVIIVKNGEINTKSYRVERNITNREKCFLIAMQKLVNGAFSLAHFDNALEFKGIKKMGPEKHYIFETKIQECPLQLSIDAETFLLKRFVIEDVSIDDYKATYDFLPAVETAGFMIPSGWYQCDLGTGASARGSQVNLENFILNPQIETDFFLKLDLNMGTSSAAIGSIEGNLTQASFNDQRELGFFSSNTIKEDIDKAGFKPEDKLIIKIGEKEFEGLFLASTNDISASATAPGTVIFASLSGSSYNGIIVFGTQFKPLFDGFKPLTEFRIIKK